MKFQRRRRPVQYKQIGRKNECFSLRCWLGDIGANSIRYGGAFAFVIVSLEHNTSNAQEILYAQDNVQAVKQQAVITGEWSNPNLSPDARAAAALAAMTHEEKIRIINANPIGVPRLGIQGVKETDASLGISNIGNFRKGFVATALPASLLLGSSWDTSLAFKSGEMVGSEARSNGFGILLGGGANLIRDPRAGRNFEYLAEDPLLTGVLAGHSIAGVQSNKIISTLKHFALNSHETGRAVYSVDIDEKEMRETELLGFQIANEIGNPGSVMCSYNRVNDVYACENSFLLNEVLRREWNYKGFVMSDWGAVHSVESLIHGLDQKSGGNIDTKLFFSKELEPKLKDGSIPYKAVDLAVARILQSLFASGVVDNPPLAVAGIDYGSHEKIAQAEAEGGIVLLQNEKDFLPVIGFPKRIAVVGGHAQEGVLSGGGSSQVVPAGGFALEIPHKGPIKRSYGGLAPLKALLERFRDSQVDYVDGKDVAAAVSVSRSADLVIIFAEKWSNESDDNDDMSLGGGQDELISAIAEENKNTVVVLETGNPVLMPWAPKVKSILAAWYPGQRGAAAIARVISGDVNPSGHLPVTWPSGIDQLPLPTLPGTDVPRANAEVRKAFGYQADRMPFRFRYPEGSDIGYRWFERRNRKPLYPFGFGRSYTSFSYDKFSASNTKSGLIFRFRVKNTGQRDGADVPQVYMSRPGSTRRLVGWSKPNLKAGESKMLEVKAELRAIADFSVTRKKWIVPKAVYTIELSHDVATPISKISIQLPAREIYP
jgi:beta-glucosidase